MPIQEAIKTNKQHAVPQNIMDVEFKLIGELTMRQFIYLAVFAGLAYGAFATIPQPFKWPIAIISALTGLGLAFVPLGDRGLDQWITNFFVSVYSPTQRIWRKGATIPTAFIQQNLAMVKQELITLAPTSSRRKLEEYLEVQGKSSKIDRLDIPEQEYIRKVRNAFADIDMAMTQATVIIEPTIETNVGALEPVDIIGSTAAPEIIQVTSAETEPAAMGITASMSDKGEKLKIPAEIRPAEKAFEKAAASTPKVGLQKKPAERAKPKTHHRTEIHLSPITPDMHAGRRFVNLTPSQGELILPIRGEKVIKTSEELVAEQSLEQKTEQLNKLIEQIQTQQKPTAPSVIQPKHKEKEQKAEKQEVTGKNRELYEEINKIKSELERLEKVAAESTEGKNAAYQLAREKVLAQSEEPVIKEYVAPQDQRYKPPQRPVFSRTSVQPQKPNIISGTVMDHNNEGLENVVVIIKNKNSEPVRAIKSNALGQFFISTPLPDGEYLVEVDSTKKTNLTFDIISVDLKGEIIAPMEFVGTRK